MYINIVTDHQDTKNFTTSFLHFIHTISKYIFIRRNDAEGYKDLIEIIKDLICHYNVETTLIYL